MKTINYYRKNVYGRELLYFVDDEDRTFFKLLTERSTLSRGDVQILEQWLDIEFKEVLPPNPISAE